MKKSTPTILTSFSHHQLLLTLLIIGLFIGAFFTTNIFQNQGAAVTAGSCYLQSEIDAKGVEKTNLENDLAATQDQITTTNKDITDNWAALTTASKQIEDLTPKVLSAYEVSKTNDLYTQLQASKSIDALKAQVLAATSGANAAKSKSTILYPQVKAAYALATTMLNKANAAKNSPTYTTLYNQYRTQLGKYNTMNAQYNAVLREYNVFVDLNTKYTNDLKLYRAKYYPNLTTTATLPTTASLQTQYDTKQKLVDASNAIKAQIATLNTQVANYKNIEATLDKQAADLAIAFSTLMNKIRDLETVIATYKTNICPLKELICNDNIDNNRNGTQDCDDLDCKGSVVCQVGGSCGDSVCSAGENHDNCPQDCEASTSSVVKYFPPYGADTDSGIEELTITFPYDINYSGGTVSIYENGVPSEVGISVSSSTSRKVTLSLANTLEPGKFYSIRANLDIGDGNMWTGGWGFRAVGGDGGGDTAIYGCTGAGADNYNPSATVDDGSCTYNGGSGGTNGTTGTTGTNALSNAENFDDGVWYINPSAFRISCEEDRYGRIAYIDASIADLKFRRNIAERLEEEAQLLIVKNVYREHINSINNTIDKLVESRKYIENCFVEPPLPNTAHCDEINKELKRLEYERVVLEGLHKQAEYDLEQARNNGEDVTEKADLITNIESDQKKNMARLFDASDRLNQCKVRFTSK